MSQTSIINPFSENYSGDGFPGDQDYMDVVSPTSNQDGSEWHLYDWFKGSVQYEYDTRIDEYNWYMMFAANLLFYVVLQLAVRKLVPEPAPKEQFIQKKKAHEYHFYYFQYTSLVHALVGCFAGKKNGNLIQV